MARNIAKSFANMTLVYWKPIMSGSGVLYEEPIEFKGKYIGNSQLGDAGASGVVFSGGGKRDNMVLFYMCEPEPEGYVSWKHTVDGLKDEGLFNTPPSDLRDTHKINEVTEYVMPDAKTAELRNMAFLASVL